MGEAADNSPKVPVRTILYYMAGDNSSGEEIQEKIEALAAACIISGRNHLPVYQDRSGKYPPSA